MLGVFSWGDWGDITDRFPGHPHSIDTMLKLDDDTVFTGSSDGLIRFVCVCVSSSSSFVCIEARMLNVSVNSCSCCLQDRSTAAEQAAGNRRRTQ